GEDGAVDPHALFAAARSDVHRLGRAGVDSQYRHFVRSEAAGRGGGFCLDHGGLRPTGRGGAGNAAESAAVVVAGCVRGGVGESVMDSMPLFGCGGSTVNKRNGLITTVELRAEDFHAATLS